MLAAPLLVLQPGLLQAHGKDLLLPRGDLSQAGSPPLLRATVVFSFVLGASLHPSHWDNDPGPEQRGESTPPHTAAEPWGPSLSPCPPSASQLPQKILPFFGSDSSCSFSPGRIHVDSMKN